MGMIKYQVEVRLEDKGNKGQKGVLTFLNRTTALEANAKLADVFAEVMLENTIELFPMDADSKLRIQVAHDLKRAADRILSGLPAEEPF